MHACGTSDSGPSDSEIGTQYIIDLDLSTKDTV